MVLNKIFGAIGLGSHSHQWTSPHTTAPNGTPIPTTVAPSYPNMGISTHPHSHTTLSGMPFPNRIAAMRRHPKAKWRKKNKLLDALSGLIDVSEYRDLGTIGGFHHVTISDAVQHLGNLRPYYNKKPTKWATLMLECAASGYVPRSMTAHAICLTGARAGIFYFGPGILGVKKKKYYITPAGLAVLHHWADKSENFARFVNAYVTKDSHKKASVDCGQLAFGIVPDWMSADYEKNAQKVEEYQKKIAEMEMAKAENRKHVQWEIDRQNYLSGINKPVTSRSITGF